MSDILIKGMEMPYNCGHCFLRRGECKERIYMPNRPSNCPLVPVPDHGNLIDMTARMSVQDRFDDNIVRQMTVKELIHEYVVGGYPKTIIPADKEVDK